VSDPVRKLSKDVNSSTSNAYATFAEAMRELIKLGLPILEVGQEQIKRTAQASDQLLEVYRKAAGSSSTNISVLLQCSMEIRQILYGIPPFYLSTLHSCLAKTLGQYPDNKLAQDNSSVIMDVGRRIAELQRDLWLSNYAVVVQIGALGNESTQRIVEKMIGQTQAPIPSGQAPPLSPPGAPVLPLVPRCRQVPPTIP